MVASQSVKQCITVDLFPHILANVVDIQKVHLLLHTPLLNKTPRLSPAKMFVRLYRLLLIHCIYVSVTKPTCPAFSAWLNTGAIRSMNVGAQWLSGRVLDSRPKGRRLEPHWRHCVVSLSKNINPSLVLVQPRKTRPFITERLLMGC